MPTIPVARRNYLPIFALSFGLTAYIAIVGLWIRPLTVHGFAPAFTSSLCRLSSLLELPGRAILRSLHFNTERHLTMGTWAITLLYGFLVYSALFLALAEIRGRLRTRAEIKKPASSDGLSRRSFLRMSTLSAAGSLAGVAYVVEIAPSYVKTFKHTMMLRDLPRELDGLRVVQLTDLHHGPWMPITQIRKVIADTNKLEPDLVLLTGDYVSHSRDYIPAVAAALNQLRPKIGVLGVLGNHDWWEDGPLTKKLLAEAGVLLIDNAKIHLTPGRKFTTTPPAEGLCIAGVGDLWTDRINFYEALHEVPKSMPRLLLAHNPDTAEREELVQKLCRVDLMLSGHTHGGQIQIPFIGTPVVPSNYGQKYAQGLVQGPGCPVYISRGIGMSILPLRLGVPPEITLITFRRAA